MTLLSYRKLIVIQIILIPRNEDEFCPNGGAFDNIDYPVNIYQFCTSLKICVCIPHFLHECMFIEFSFEIVVHLTSSLLS